MNHIRRYWIFACIFYWCLKEAHGFPVPNNVPDPNDSATGSFATSPLFIILSIGAAICAVTILAMCTCCHDALFSPKGDTSDTLPRRHSMEPPSQSSLSTPRASEADLAVTIEPLPDVAGSRTGKSQTKPMGYNQVVNKGPDISDWFQQNNNVPDFPRGQLQYVKELGSGWFGSVVEGEASKMSPQKRKVKVVVQILREDLTSMERAYLLHTAKMFRDVSHDNVLKIIGKCVDKEPYLLLFEHCPQGDYLKSYLIARRGISDDLVHGGQVLKMCCEVADGLAALHRNGFVHSDLACRNCLVGKSGEVKIGDYGTGFTVYKNEYFVVGDIAVPIRWISPDSVEVASGGQLLTKEVTQVDNVWTLGVVLWEIMEFGKLPYMELSDDGVINMVLKNRSTYLQSPLTPSPQRDRLYEILRFCWLPPNTRPSSEEISSLLHHVYDFRPNVDSHDAFDAKWNSLVAARKPALLAANYDGNSYSPVPTDPAIVQMITELKGASPVSSPTSTNVQMVTNTFESATLVSPTATTTNFVHEHPISPPKIVPAVEVDDAERIEKRTFILTLNMADLAAMDRQNLAEFYEYLSPDEITDMEKCHARAVEEAEEAKEKKKKRDHFLAMSLTEMEELKAEELDHYLRCLDELERQETQSKLARSAEEKRKKHERLQAERKRIFAMSTADIVALTEEDFQEMGQWLSDEELDILRGKWRHQNEVQNRRRAERFLTLEDRELAQVGEEELQAELGYLAHDQADQLRKRHEKLLNMKTMILNASEAELADLTDGEFEHYAGVLPFNHEEMIRARRNQQLEKRQREHEEHKQREEAEKWRLEEERNREIEKKRNAIFALSAVELANWTPDELASFAGVINDHEMDMLHLKRMETMEAREGILSLDADTLRTLSKEEIENYYRFLTPDEIRRFETIRSTIPTPEFRSPSAEGTRLADEALQTAKDQLIDMESPTSLNGDVQAKMRQYSANKQHSVEPLTLNSLELEAAGRNLPLATPELRVQHHSKRDKILTSDEESLRGMSQEEFEEYFQYLTPDEIFDLEERRRRQVHASVPEENGEGGFHSGSAWEARDYVLHLSDHQLASLNDEELKKFAGYFTSEEFNQIERRRVEICEKRDFINHSTDEELAVLPTEKLEEYLDALPEEDRSPVRDRVNVIQTRWLPATLRDEDAFREILKTVPSISFTSESESYTPHRGAAESVSFGATNGLLENHGTPASSLETDETPQFMVTSADEAHHSSEQQRPRHFDDLFGPETTKKEPTGGLYVPELRILAATPVEELADDPQFKFVTSDHPILKLDETGLDDGPNTNDADHEERITSTPVYEMFADSMLKDIGAFTPIDQNSSHYMTAQDDIWNDSTVEALDKTEAEEGMQTANQHDQEVADLFSNNVVMDKQQQGLNGGDFGGDLFQLEPTDDNGSTNLAVAHSNDQPKAQAKNEVSLLD